MSNSEYNRQYYQLNKQKITEQRTQYYESNKQKITEQRTQYYESNKELVKESKKKHYESTKQSNPLYIKFKGMITGSKASDKKCNRIGTDIDYYFLLEQWTTQEQLCYYCKCEMLLEFNKTKMNPQKITIQRLDNELAHTKANCVFACFDCNCNKYMELK